MTREPTGGAPSRPPGEASSSEPPRPSAYLHPGQLVVSSSADVVLTILGSCVAVCLWDARRHMGGMSHFLLPYRSDPSETPRAGGVAVSQLLERLLALGCQQPDLRAKLFGGGKILARQASNAPSLGAKNVELARELLADAGIPIVAESVGGPRGRRLIFETATGTAWVKLL